MVSLSPTANITPSLRLGYAESRLGGFAESGAGLSDLTLDAASLRSLTSVVGVKAEKRFGSSVYASVSVGWEHQFLDTRESVGATFADSDTTTIVGTPLSRDGAVFGLRLGGQAGTLHWGVSYDVKVDGLYSEQTAAAGLKVSF